MEIAPVLVCNVAWMKWYQGPREDDPPVGGGAYVVEHGFGHEMFNFAPIDGVCYGYVQVNSVGGGPANLVRLGGKSGDDHVTGVTVMWVATHPTEGGARVVGWYEDATVYGARQPSPDPRARRIHQESEAAPYVVKALNANTHLVSADRRDHTVPRGKDGLGQANIAYAEGTFAATLVAYIESVKRQVRADALLGSPRMVDVDRRLEIEYVAMLTTTEHFGHLGYEVRRVNKENLGWDLEATLGVETLKIEVKGTSATRDSFVVEVTPNEYAKMLDPEHRPDYRLAVVTDCAGSQPMLAIFAWSDARGLWISADGRQALSVMERTAARITSSALVFSPHGNSDAPPPEVSLAVLHDLS